MKILGTGLQGLIGSRIVELLSSHYTFENISRTTGADITNRDQVIKAIRESEASIVLHMAAKADVDGCEADRILGEDGQAWQINVEGTKNVAKACEQFGKKLIYVSTDFVFDGEKESYTEEDLPNPINWYARTKFEGEKIAKSLSTPWLIIRIAYPYRAHFLRNDFFRAIKVRLEKGESLQMVTDHIMTPTFVDDLPKALDILFQKNSKGIYHLAGGEYISPFESAVQIAKMFGYKTTGIEKTTRAEFFKGRAPRPFRLALKNDKIRGLGVTMKTFEEGLREIKKQLL